MNRQAFFLQSQWQDKLPKKSMPLITQSLENIDEKKLNTLSLISLKNPITGLVLHWLVGFLGAGRFYKGNPICGVIQIILSICMIICLVGAWDIVEEMDNFPKYPTYSEYANIDKYGEAVTEYNKLQRENMAGLIFCAFLVIDWVIYMIVEYFLIYRGIKEDNLNKILSYLR